MPTFLGTAGPDFFPGTTGSDDIYGYGGNDQILGGGGGFDSLFAGQGNDVVSATSTLAIVYGGQDLDSIRGSSGGDVIQGDLGDDTLSGQAGNDQIGGLDGNDRLLGDDGDDSLYGNAGQDTLLGGSGNDFIYGGQGSDVLEGNAGNDYLRGDLGADIMRGGAGGVDTFVIDAEAGVVDIIDQFTFTSPNQDILQVFNAPGHYAQAANNDMLLKFAGGQTFAIVYGAASYVNTYNASPRRVGAPSSTAAPDPLTDFSALSSAETSAAKPSNPLFDDAYLDRVIAEAKQKDPSVNVFDPRQYPVEYFTTPSLDSKTILKEAIAALEKGQPIPEGPGRGFWMDASKVTIGDLKSTLADIDRAEYMSTLSSEQLRLL